MTLRRLWNTVWLIISTQYLITNCVNHSPAVILLITIMHNMCLFTMHPGNKVLNTMWCYCTGKHFKTNIFWHFKLTFLLIRKSVVVFLLAGCFMHSAGNQQSADCGGEQRRERSRWFRLGRGGWRQETLLNWDLTQDKAICVHMCRCSYTKPRFLTIAVFTSLRGHLKVGLRINGLN